MTSNEYYSTSNVNMSSLNLACLKTFNASVKIWHCCFAHVARRNFHCTSVYCNNANIKRSWTKKTERYIDKMTTKITFGDSGKSKKRKKKWYIGTIPPLQMTTTEGTTPQRRTANENNERRAKQLSVVLAQYINSLMNSGEICPELVDIGFEILKVKMSSDFSVVNVYWMASSVEQEDVESLLEPAARKLRSALVDLHIMGQLPRIQFLKDVSTARLQQVQDLLAIADFGDDYEPTDIAADMRSDPEIDYEKASLQVQLARISETFDTDAGYDNVAVPGPGGSLEIIGRVAAHESDMVVPEKNESVAEFKQNLYDVDHTRLIRQVIAARNKARDRSFEMPSSANTEKQESIADRFARSDVDRLLAQRHRQRHEVVRREASVKQKLLSVPQTSMVVSDDDDEVVETDDYLDERNL